MLVRSAVVSLARRQPRHLPMRALVGSNALRCLCTSTPPPPPPLHERLMSDASAMFSSIKEKLSGGSRAASGPIDEDTTTVVVKEPSFWEKTFNQANDSSVLRGFFRFFGAAGDATGGAVDRVFGETEQAEALTMLREDYPEFSQEQLMKHVSTTLGPNVLGAYLRGDVDVLRSTCREQAYALLHASVMEREARMLRMDERILHMSEPELEGVRIVNERPTPVISFETHQLNCIRSRATNAVVEGDEDDIRSVHYLWALQLNEQSDAPEEERWQVTELAIRGMAPVY